MKKKREIQKDTILLSTLFSGIFLKIDGDIYNKITNNHQSDNRKSYICTPAHGNSKEKHKSLQDIIQKTKVKFLDKRDNLLYNFKLREPSKLHLENSRT